MRGSTAIRPATCMPSVLTALAPAMWGWPSAPSCTITTAPARDGAQPGASWAVLHHAPHQLVSEHDDRRCARRPVPAHSGSRRGVGQACRRAPPARDGAQPACLRAVVHPAPHQAGQEGLLLPVVLAEPRRRARADAVRPARTRHSRQARRRASEVPRAHPTPACGGVFRCWSHTPSTARRSPRRLRDCRDDTGPWQTNWARCLCDGAARACHYTPHPMPKPGFGPPQPAVGCRTHPRTPCQSPALACRSLWRSVGRAPQR